MWNVVLEGKGVVVLWLCVSVLHWGGRVQEFGSAAYKCEDALPDCVYDIL